MTERTREIGIKKALGARRSDILRQFLMEALLVSLMGGAAGIAAGLAFGMLAESMGMAFSASWGVVAVAVAASTVIGNEDLLQREGGLASCCREKDESPPVDCSCRRDEGALP